MYIYRRRERGRREARLKCRTPSSLSYYRLLLRYVGLVSSSLGSSSLEGGEAQVSDALKSLVQQAAIKVCQLGDYRRLSTVRCA
jgi:hypothetical protein